MKLIIGTFLLLTAAFCAFGFMAAFEPTDKTTQSIAFRIGYAVIGLICLVIRFQLGAVAFGILVVIVASVFFQSFRGIALWLGIIAAGLSVLALIAVFVVFILFSRALRGPKSLSGTRCPKCRKRQAMQETSRNFLRGNALLPFDHYRVMYRCTECGYEREQEELVALSLPTVSADGSDDHERRDRNARLNR